MRKLNYNTMKKILLITLIFSCLGCFAQVETEYEKYDYICRNDSRAHRSTCKYGDYDAEECAEHRYYHRADDNAAEALENAHGRQCREDYQRGYEQ